MKKIERKRYVKRESDITLGLITNTMKYINKKSKNKYLKLKVIPKHHGRDYKLSIYSKLYSKNPIKVEHYYDSKKTLFNKLDKMSKIS